MSEKLPLHDLFFWTASFFLLGVLFGSATQDFSYKLVWVLVVILIFAILLRLRRSRIFFVLFVFIGAIYFYVFDYLQTHPVPVFDQKIKFYATVKKVDLKINGQELVVKTDTPEIKLKIETFRYPTFNYGDYIEVEGKISKNKSEFISGVLYKPKITLIKTGKGYWLKGELLKIRNGFENNLKKVLPYNQAVFLSGLTVGGKSEFSKELEEKFRKSGTLHLVALSGFNILIIVNYLGAFFRWFLSRRKAVWFTCISIILFVMMTGAEASIIRAAIMGFIVILAEQSGRLFNVRNAIAAAALIMVLFNPKILVFDLGFQLSFLALIGIVYLKPILEGYLPRFLQRKFLLKDEISTTISAEVVVLPVLFLKFGHTSPWGIISNPLIALFIPLTMGLGFLTGALGFISYYLSLPFGWLVNILLTYELEIINFFAFYF
ncbi:MAG: ComEC/Rec2 family competence protein [Patescibacteria group bacterium]